MPSMVLMPSGASSAAISPNRPSRTTQPIGISAGEVGACCHRVWIAVDGDDAAVRGGEEGAAIAAGAEGAVDIDRLVAGRERAQDRVKQHRCVPEGGDHAGSPGAGRAAWSDGTVAPWRRARSRISC